MKNTHFTLLGPNLLITISICLLSLSLFADFRSSTIIQVGAKEYRVTVLFIDTKSEVSIIIRPLDQEENMGMNSAIKLSLPAFWRDINNLRIYAAREFLPAHTTSKQVDLEPQFSRLLNSEGFVVFGTSELVDAGTESQLSPHYLIALDIKKSIEHQRPVSFLVRMPETSSRSFPGVIIQRWTSPELPTYQLVFAYWNEQDSTVKFSFPQTITPSDRPFYDHSSAFSDIDNFGKKRRWTSQNANSPIIKNHQMRLSPHLKYLFPLVSESPPAMVSLITGLYPMIPHIFPEISALAPISSENPPLLPNYSRGVGNNYEKRSDDGSLFTVSSEKFSKLMKNSHNSPSSKFPLFLFPLYLEHIEILMEKIKKNELNFSKEENKLNFGKEENELQILQNLILLFDVSSETLASIPKKRSSSSASTSTSASTLRNEQSDYPMEDAPMFIDYMRRVLVLISTHFIPDLTLDQINNLKIKSQNIPEFKRIFQLLFNKWKKTNTSLRSALIKAALNPTMNATTEKDSSTNKRINCSRLL